MTQQWTFTRFDLLNLIGQPRQYLVAFGFVVVAAVATPLPALAVLAAAAIVSLMAATPFALDERGRLDTLYATLPTSRGAVVVGRYLTILALWAAVAAVGAVAALAAPALRGRTVDPGLLVLLLVASFAVVALAVSVQLPIFFAIGYTRARPFRYLPIFLMAAVAWTAGQLGLYPEDLAGSNLDLTTVSIGVVAAGIALLVGSALVARALYVRRQL